MSVIRSTHERRILDWLADSSGTVSEVAGALKMRVPHASAAFKKLRQKGYVCLLYTSPSPRDGLLSRMPSSA